MIRRQVPLGVVALALVLAGCGSDESTPTATQNSPAKNSPAAPLRVAITDARVGDAVTATAKGIEELKVPTQQVNPNAVERRRERREGVGAGASCENTSVMPEANNLPVIEAATLCLLNGERADAGLAPLTTNAKLAQSAIGHTTDMIQNQYFAHSGLDGSDVVARIRETGYIADDAAWTVGENLAWGTGSLAAPAGIVNAWMNSEGHRENILNPSYREIGFGIAIGNPRAPDGQGATYTTNFGTINGGRALADAEATPSTNVAGSRTSSKKKQKCKRYKRVKRRDGKTVRRCAARYARKR